MALADDKYAQRALDFVERLQQLSLYDDICNLITLELEWFGFNCVSSWSMPGPGSDPEDCILINNRPAEYIDRYVEKNYVLRDPVITELRKTLTPYSWSDVRKRRNLDKTELTIMDEASEFDATDGFIVPIVTLSGSLTVFSPCGLEPDLTKRSRAAIEIIGMFSYHALKRALICDQREEAARTPLTPREREVMKWVATGKTDEEIANILSIRTTTATQHVENSKRKLDAFKRTYAIVQALRYGEIAL